MEYKTYCISTKCDNKNKCLRNFYTLISIGIMFEVQVKLVVNNCYNMEA